MKWKNPLSNSVQRLEGIDNRSQKEAVADRIANRVNDGDVIGVGSGSTSFLAIQAIGKHVQEDQLKITAIPTSREAALNCSALGIPVTDLMHARPDWAFDGADEVDPDNNLIKGRGGAMYVEKLVLTSSPENYILVDESKFVQQLGSKFSIPLEIDPQAIHVVDSSLERMAAEKVELRNAEGKDGPVITDSGNFILDVQFRIIEDTLEKELKSIPGVIESGLFIKYPVEVISG
ncbi:ribose 5-phosphate isomerase A [Sediminibacillus massiliensis]|uniref:ribose 5-phosphate isomerase A n=1 Tax=Sediminibacillus massiliensis TaxID=1926277 RepID=UPI0009886C24|nr:ribose 5-phosphate isomerase A [Sediminibacillus massiliensis]